MRFGINQVANWETSNVFVNIVIDMGIRSNMVIAN